MMFLINVSLLLVILLIQVNNYMSSAFIFCSSVHVFSYIQSFQITFLLTLCNKYIIFKKKIVCRFIGVATIIAQNQSKARSPYRHVQLPKKCGSLLHLKSIVKSTRSNKIVHRQLVLYTIV